MERGDNMGIDNETEKENKQRSVTGEIVFPSEEAFIKAMSSHNEEVIPYGGKLVVEGEGENQKIKLVFTEVKPTETVKSDTTLGEEHDTKFGPGGWPNK